ncbi:immunoglobulin J chain [Hyperolius riggenbachi]|uniref:immunoglobulin J chain n=1 Tax=Hyperolius riggenbachi TaxID=752182 RepID=UPI0035A3D2CF
MNRSSLLSAAVLLHFAVYVTGYFYGDPEYVLVDNKCKCVKVTSRFVPSEDNPNEEVLQRNIVITVPLKSRINISDPTSPLRTHFVYNFLDLCRKCDPVEIEIGGEPVLVSQDNCEKSEDVCYTYDRNKCYTSELTFRNNGMLIKKKVPLNPESCYE